MGNLKSDDDVFGTDNRRYTHCTWCDNEIGDRYWSHSLCVDNDAYCSKDCVCSSLEIEDWNNIRED